MFKIINSGRVSWPDDSCLMNDGSDIVSPRDWFKFRLNGRRIAFLTITVHVVK